MKEIFGILAVLLFAVTPAFSQGPEIKVYEYETVICGTAEQLRHFAAVHNDGDDPNKTAREKVNKKFGIGSCSFGPVKFVPLKKEGEAEIEGIRGVILSVRALALRVESTGGWFGLDARQVIFVEKEEFETLKIPKSTPVKTPASSPI